MSRFTFTFCCFTNVLFPLFNLLYSVFLLFMCSRTYVLLWNVRCTKCTKINYYYYYIITIHYNFFLRHRMLLLFSSAETKVSSAELMVLLICLSSVIIHCRHPSSSSVVHPLSIRPSTFALNHYSSFSSYRSV